MTTRRKIEHSLLLFTLIWGVVPAADAVDRQLRGGVRICHQPPSRPATFQDITVSRGVLGSHLDHGDWLGTCSVVQSWVDGLGDCDPSCDDGNACTIDICDRLCTTPECTTSVSFCRREPPRLDCDDGDLCTTDSCDVALGCRNTPLDCGAGDECSAAGSCVVSDGRPECVDGPPLPDDTPCDDGDSGTVGDVCIGGICEGTLAGCPCWDGDLRIADDLAPLGGSSLILDPDPLCGMDPPAPDAWDVVCRDSLTYATYIHPEICPDFEGYGSLIQMSYQTSDGDMGRQCEASITDAGYYSMFQLRARVDNLSQVEFEDCQALLRQLFPCP